MGLAGNLFQVFGLIASLVAIVVYFLAFKDKSDVYLKIGNYLFLSVAGLIVIASIILAYSLAVSDFTIEYVARYTDLGLPSFYKLSAFWAGQAGSLLFWVLLLVIFSAIEIFRIRKKEVQYQAITYITLAISTAFFILLCIAEQNPFKMLDFIPRDGQGMNPMLQNPGMVVHPPTLYIGYVGFNIVFAHAVAAIVTKDFSANWIKLSRNWAVIVWAFLTVGIVIGGWWAYVELGWGGYWAWDPVENASLFPWITATAFLHSAIIYEKRERLKVWAFMLILVTFELTIFGTFITRSGVIESVHSFGKNPIGAYFLWFIFLTTVAYLILFFTGYSSAKKRNLFESNHEFNFLSREGLFFIANWLFIGTTFVIFFGTILPWLSEIFTGQKATVELSYFNRVSLPFFSCILLAAGIAPLIGYGDYTPKKFFMRLLPSIAVMAVAMAIFYILGFTKFSPLLVLGLTAFAATAVVIRVSEMLKAGGLSSLTKGKRFYASMLIHTGVVAIAFGVTMSSFYNKNIDEIVFQDSEVKLEDYTLQIGRIHSEEGSNYFSTYLPIKVVKDGKQITEVFPEMRVYDKQPEKSFAEVAYYSKITKDLYFILSGFDLEANQVRIQAIIQPFVGWIWFGCILMTIGAIYSTIPFRRKQS